MIKKYSNITELNELFYAGANQVSKKYDIPLKNPNRNIKPELEIWPEG